MSANPPMKAPDKGPFAAAGCAAFVGLIVFAVAATAILGTLKHRQLHAAARTGNLKSLKAMLDREPERLEARDVMGHTPLQTAAGSGRNAEVLRELIRRGADVNARGHGTATGDEEWTPLHFSATQENLEVVSVLIKAGAAVNALSAKGETPLDIATREGSWAIAESLRANGGVSGKP